MAHTKWIGWSRYFLLVATQILIFNIIQYRHIRCRCPGFWSWRLVTNQVNGAVFFTIFREVSNWHHLPPMLQEWRRSKAGALRILCSAKFCWHLYCYHGGSTEPGWGSDDGLMRWSSCRDNWKYWSGSGARFLSSWSPGHPHHHTLPWPRGSNTRPPWRIYFSLFR